jgi:acyl-CoA synthetase (AMP-forming)/AMP-acid ligase II
VVLLLPDGLGWAAVFFGAFRLGVVAVLLNTRLELAVWAGRAGRRYKSLYRSHAAGVGGPGNVFDRDNRIDVILIQKIDASSLGALK